MNVMSSKLIEMTGIKDYAGGSRSKQYVEGGLVAGAPPGTKVLILARKRRPVLGRLPRGSAAVIKVGEAMVDARGNYSTEVELDTKQYEILARIPARNQRKGEVAAL